MLWQLRILKIFADEIIKRDPKVVGISRLIIKDGSDNFRSSCIHGIIIRIKDKGMEVVLCEPVIEESKILNSEVIKDLSEFNKNDVINLNRH